MVKKQDESSMRKKIILILLVSLLVPFLCSIPVYKNYRIRHKMMAGVNKEFLDEIRNYPSNEVTSYFLIIPILEQLIKIERWNVTAISSSGILLEKLDELSQNGAIPDDRDSELLQRYTDWALMEEQRIVIKRILMRSPYRKKLEAN